MLYLDGSHPPEFELSRRTLYNCHPWRQFPVTKTWNILFRYTHTIIYYSGVRSRNDPTDFPEYKTDFVWQIFAPIFNFFRERNFVFLSSREDTWRVVAFNGVLIYFGSYLPYLFSILPIISGFFLYWPNPFYIYFPLFFLQLCASDLLDLMSLLWLEYYFVFWCVSLDTIGDIFHKFVIIFTDYRTLFFQ
jgi:hypothetical protein